MLPRTNLETFGTHSLQYRADVTCLLQLYNQICYVIGMQTFVALADQTRREIVEALAAREQAVGDLVAQFHISQPAISRHLRVLRDAGLVRVRVDGQRRMYSVDAKGFEVIEVWLDKHRRKIARQLDALERHLDTDATQKRKPR